VGPGLVLKAILIQQLTTAMPQYVGDGRIYADCGLLTNNVIKIGADSSLLCYSGCGMRDSRYTLHITKSNLGASAPEGVLESARGGSSTFHVHDANRPLLKAL
jgi:hypothetical protein